MQVLIGEQNDVLWETGTKFQNTAVALGCFDALHMGHQAIIQRVVDAGKAQGLTSLVYFFINQPKSVLLGKEIPHIYSLEQRLCLLEKLGVEVAIAQRFNEKYLECPPERFVQDCLKKQLGASLVAAGFNYRFGKGGQGDIQTLKELGETLGIRVCGVSCVEQGGEVVSSTWIRQLIENGEMEEANACLGRIFAVEGEVSPGNQIGRTMTFPTANLALPKGQVYPAYGVYLTETCVQGIWYPSITNVGTRPTIEEDTTLIETHLLDYAGDLYGKKIAVGFHKRIREIEKFPDIQRLQEQLERDKQTAKEYFAK